MKRPPASSSAPGVGFLPALGARLPGLFSNLEEAAEDAAGLACSAADAAHSQREMDPPPSATSTLPPTLALVQYSYFDKALEKDRDSSFSSIV